MNGVTLRHPGLQNHYQVFPARDIPENSFHVKFACVFPVFGYGNAVFDVASRSLKERMTETTYYAPALIELIEIKNELTFINTIGNFIVTAVMVAMVASSIISGAAFSAYFIPLLLGALTGTTTVQNMLDTAHNSGVIAELQATGFRDGMIVK